LNIKKLILTGVCLSFSLAAVAQQPPGQAPNGPRPGAAGPNGQKPPGGGDPAKFAEHKQKALARIQEHMQGLQAFQSCVQGAADHAAMKVCHENHKALREAHQHRQ
jgi:hypothetical protein